MREDFSRAVLGVSVQYIFDDNGKVLSQFTQSCWCKIVFLFHESKRKKGKNKSYIDILINCEHSLQFRTCNKKKKI